MSDEQTQLREFEQSLPMALLRAREAVMDRFRPTLREHGVTEQQWRVLRALDGGTPLDLGEIARRCCLLSPSVTRIVRGLEAKGWVSRTTDGTDQRRFMIGLRKEGRSLLRQVGPHSEHSYAEIARCIGQDNLKALYALLGLVVTRLDTEPATAPRRVG